MITNLSLPNQQRWLINAMNSMGYNIPQGGICFGIACIGMQIALTNIDCNVFSQYLELINKFSKLELKEYPISKEILALLSFFDGVLLYHFPGKYRHLLMEDQRTYLFQENSRELVFDLIKPKQNKNLSIYKIYSFSGCYSINEINMLLTILATLATKINPLIFMLQTHNHVLIIKYNKQTLKWSIIDANLLGIIKNNYSHTEIAEILYIAFVGSFPLLHNRHEYLTFVTEIFTAITEISFSNTLKKNIIAILHDNFNWKKIHSITKNKLTKTKDGGTWLYISIQNKINQTITTLLEANCDPNLTKEDGVTPLYVAAQQGYEQIVEQLLTAKAYVDPLLSSSVTPLWVATKNGHYKVVSQLLAAKANYNIKKPDGTNLMLLAAERNYTKTLIELLHANANINESDNDGVSPLYIAAQNGHTKTVELLIQTKAWVNILDNENTTPLWIAAQNNHFNVIEQLLDAKANHTIADNHSITPLMIANHQNHTNIVEKLLKL